MKKALISLALLTGLSLVTSAASHKILFFSKSSGYEHSVISWKKGQPSFAEKVLLEIGSEQGWTFEFSKDGSKFSPEYLKQFDTVIFYTTGDLTKPGKDKQPPMTPEGKQALLDYVKAGNGFIGLHSASDSFHTRGENGKELSRHENHGSDSDEYICMIGGEFLSHGAQQVATNRVINPDFPGYEDIGLTFAVKEEWYSLKDFNPDIHCLTVIESDKLEGPMYQRPDFPTSWARAEGQGRVYYNAMGHRNDIWTSDLYKNMIIGAVKWTTSEVDATIPPNLKEVAPSAMALNNPPSAELAEETFRPLFNGKNYEGWYIKLKEGDQALGERVFAIEDGMIHVFDDSWPDEIDLDEGTDATIGMIYTEKTFDRYHLKFEYKWGRKKANYFAQWQYDAGVYYHITDDKVFPTGVEFQIHYIPEEDRNRTGDLIRPPGQAYDWYFNPETSEYLHPDQGGILYKKQKSYKGKKWLHNAKVTRNFNALNDEWNSCEIIVMGGEYAIHKLNGEVVNMAFNLKPAAGIIGFQSETAEIYYRNIQIKEFGETVPAERFLNRPDQTDQ